MAQGYEVFLSYNSKDRSLVGDVAQLLRQRGIVPWRDVEELVPGRPWIKAVEEIILTVPTAAVFVGAHGIGPWEEPEMEALLLQRVRRRLPVIPVLLPGAPEDPSLPPFLQAFTWVDLRPGLTPEGIDRLAWGITGRKPGEWVEAEPGPREEPLKPDAAQAWNRLVAQCRERAEREIRARISHKYIPALYVPRTLDSLMEEFVGSERRCLLVIDKAGSGKTNLLCHLALSHAETHPVVFLPGKVPLSSRFDLELEIYRRLGGEPGDEAVSACLESAAALGRPVLIFLDGINENNQREYLKEGLIQLILDSGHLPLRFVISCRDLFWGYFHEGEKDFWREHSFLDAETSNHNFRLEEFTPVEFQQAKEKYFAYFNLAGHFHRDAAVKCRHPLLLRFFCEAHGRPEHERQREGIADEAPLNLGHIPDIRLKTLFDTYWDRKLERISELDSRIRSRMILERFLYSLAKRMRLDRSRSLSRDNVVEATGTSDTALFESIYTRIYDEDIILEEEKDFGSVTFVYEEFLEYTMARQLFLTELDWRGKGAPEIAKEIQSWLHDYREYNHIESVVQYLLLWIEDTRSPLHLDVMGLLLDREDPRLARLVCNCLPKLRTIEHGVIRLMKRLTKHSSLEIRREVVDALGRVLHRQPREVYSMLKRLARDRDLQHRTVQSLHYQGDVAPRQTADILHYLISGGGSQVRQAVAIFYRTEVGSLEPDQALADLQTLARDPDEGVQRECLETARIFLPGHLDRVLRLMRELTSPWICRKACDNLVAADLPAEALPRVWDLLETYVERRKSPVSDGVLKVLSRYGPGGDPARALALVGGILAQKDPRTFNQAARVLADLTNDGTRVFEAYRTI